MPTHDYSDWLTKAEAAQVLQCAEKTIERLAARGKIQQASRRVPNRRPIAVFHPKDIEKLKAETLTTQPFIAPDGDQAEPSRSAMVPSSQTSPANFLTALATAMQQQP